MTLGSDSGRLAALRAAFAEAFGAPPRLFRAPGRINLVGEHTDYNDGFVLPAAIDRACVVAAAANGRNSLHVVSRALGEARAIAADAFEKKGDWTDYVAGVFFAMRAAGAAAPCCDLMIESDVPMGAGVSSSAALEVATALALTALSGAAIVPEALARHARRAEQDYAGMPCGPMDQFVSAHGRAGKALLLDCRSVHATEIPIPGEAAFIVIDSGVRHRLVSGGYEARRAECAAAAAALGVGTLRDVRLEDVQRAGLTDTLARRARHVVSENARCKAAVEALRAGELIEVGALMNASHESLRADFEVTCAETDSLAACAQAVPGVLGARQMGGGFGGAVLALTRTADAARALEEIVARYGAMLGRRPEAFVCRVGDGAAEITP